MNYKCERLNNELKSKNESLLLRNLDFVNISLTPWSLWFVEFAVYDKIDDTLIKGFTDI